MIKNTICIGSCAPIFTLRLKISGVSGGKINGEFDIPNNNYSSTLRYRIDKTNSIVGRKINLTLRLVSAITNWPTLVRLTVEFSSDGKTVWGTFNGKPITGTYAGES